ncbi:MAG: copper oxidase, partial [Gammaproteobacteria bacterium]|nr:copper oxidase [Gammaproteobacteria bacterium]
MKSRRDFFAFAGIAGGALAAGSVARAAMVSLPEPVVETSAATRPPLQPTAGRPYRPVVTLN